ncbi:retrotransposon protein, putative, ty1-copia subclass [Tanacetum coccineum]
MVRSMMSLTTLPLSFWDYALESAACILNMVPTKKVDKTPYELWHGKVPNLTYLKDTKETMDDEDILPSENTSEHPIEEESLALIVSQEEDVVPVRRSHSLGDLNEPNNYKAALSDPEFEKWLVAMNEEMQSMNDNNVWKLVVLPPNAKVVKMLASKY